MKKFIAIILAFSLLLTACSSTTKTETKNSNSANKSNISDSSENGSVYESAKETNESIDIDNKTVYEYEKLDDPDLIPYIEDEIYSELVDQIDSDKYLVHEVKAVYISKEYMEELAYNSQCNIYFGYTLAEIEAQFQGEKYMFSLGEDGHTVVVPASDYDTEFNEVVRNVMIGSGVILVCVTISVVSAGAGAPAMSAIFAASAKTGTIFALSSGAFSGLSAGLITGVSTGDWNQALKDAEVAASEGFMFGAIGGAVTGGAIEYAGLRSATLNGLTMNEAALIQKQSGYPFDVISQFQSMEQYEICQDAGLTNSMVNGKAALIRDIDLNYVDEMGKTNLQRMQEGLAALDPETGLPYQLHHIGQRNDSTLAILTRAEHMQGGNNKIWHPLEGSSQIDRQAFDTIRSNFWKSLASSYV